MESNIQEKYLNRGDNLRIATVLFAFSLNLSSHVYGSIEPNQTKFADVVQVTQQESYVASRSFVGRIEAAETTEAGFEIEGSTAEIYVDEGDSFRKGQVLARLNTDRLLASKRESAAAVDEAKAQLSLAESTLKRIQEAITAKAVSSQELDEAVQARNLAEAGLKRREAALDRINVEIEKADLLAPFDGQVTRRISDSGRVVSIGDPILLLQNTTSLEARIGFSNALSDTFKIGQKVLLQVNGEALFATVKSASSVRDNRVRTVDVIFTIPESAHIRPGDLARITLSQTKEAQGFWVPLSALTENIRGLWSLYGLKDNNLVERKVVDLIHLESDRAFVRGTFSDGEFIVVDGVHRIVPGLTIHPSNTANSLQK